MLLLKASAHAIPLADESVQCVVTSPPYWSLRSYEGEQRLVWGGEPGHEHEWGSPTTRLDSRPQATNGAHTRGLESASVGRAFMVEGGAFCPCGAWYGALGLEPTPDLYVEHMGEVFREVRRVLRKDGTLWLNLGASYAGGAANSGGANQNDTGLAAKRGDGYKPKDLVPIPWLVALALQRDGWWLRSDIIWSKPNPMPGSQRDRPTASHEYVFLLTKAERYFYDAEAIREPQSEATLKRYDYGFNRVGKGEGPNGASHTKGEGPDGGYIEPNVSGRTARTVWTIPTSPRPEAHFATFPLELARRCIAAGSTEGDVVLDPFMGSGTTGRAAVELGRRAVGLDLSEAYLRDIAMPYIEQAEPFGAVADPIERAAKRVAATGEGQAVMPF